MSDAKMVSELLAVSPLACAQKHHTHCGICDSAPSPWFELCLLVEKGRRGKVSRRSTMVPSTLVIRVGKKQLVLHAAWLTNSSGCTTSYVQYITTATVRCSNSLATKALPLLVLGLRPSVLCMWLLCMWRRTPYQTRGHRGGEGRFSCVIRK